MSKELFQKQLDSFKKSNNVRKLALANKAGYATIDAYKEHLENQIKGVSGTKAKSTEKKASKTTVAKKVVEAVSSGLTDMVIAFDTTASMNSYIASVRQHVKDLIPTLFAQNPGLKISIVAFGDYCDMTSSKVFGKAYQVIGLTDNANSLIDFVNTAKQTSGGDGDEFYELVIKKITEETEWREGSNRSVLLIADAMPHAVGYSHGMIVQNAQIDWRVEAKKASDKGIIFDTLRILPNHSWGKWYVELSQMTGGVCLPFSSSHKTSQLVEATALARGGDATKSAFMAKSMSAGVKGDAELDAVYGMYKTTVTK